MASPISLTSSHTAMAPRPRRSRMVLAGASRSALSLIRQRHEWSLQGPSIRFLNCPTRLHQMLLSAIHFLPAGGVAGISDFTTHASELNQIPANRLDPNAVKLLGVYPTPTARGISNNFFQSPSGSNTINQFDVRIDQSFGAKDRLFGVYDFSHYDLKVPSTLPGIADGANYGQGDNPESTLCGGGWIYPHLYADGSQ